MALVSDKFGDELQPEVDELRRKVAELEVELHMLTGKAAVESEITSPGLASGGRDEERFRDFAESSADWFWETDAEHRFTFVSANAVRIIGVSPEFHYGKSRLEFVHKCDDDALTEYTTALESRQPFRNFVYYRDDGTADTEPKWLSVSGKPLFDENGAFTGYRGSGRDVSREYEMQAQVAQADRLLRDALDSMGDALFMFDADDRLVVCNNQYRRLFDNLSDQMVPGVRFEDLARAIATSGRVAAAQGRVEAYLRDRMNHHREPKDSFELELVPNVWVRVSEQRTSDGGWIGSITDITEYKRALEAAEKANIAKTKFLAAASHDLRQPLQALTLMLSLLSARITEAKTKELVQDAEGALEVMSRLLNALLDISKLDAGLVVPDIQPCHVGDLLSRLVRQFSRQAGERGLQLRCLPINAWALTDVGLLERIVNNLLANALRYTETGGVLLGCRRRGTNLVIEVWDSGIGIAADECDAVFSEFYQIGNAERNRQRGLGLGLAIVERLSTLLDHRIDVRSVPGRGSVFSVAVPQCPPPRPNEDPATGFMHEPNALAGMQVLLIEDDEDVRRVMNMALSDLGVVVCEAGDGGEAYRRVTEDGIRPDAILADYRLPDETWGHNVIQRIRELCGRDVPAAIITADTAPAALREIESSGCRVLYKPVELDSLAGVLIEASGRS